MMRHGPSSPSDLISHVIGWLDRFPAVVPGMPVAETLKFAPGGIVSRTVDRACIWTAQTPQGFTYDKILAAYRKAEAERTARPHRRCLGCRTCGHCHIHDPRPSRRTAS